MRVAILALSVVLFAAGCATQPAKPPPSDVSALPNDPMLNQRLSLDANDVAQLRSRLDRLRVGMTRDEVMGILNLSSFHVHSFAYTNPTGITYRFRPNHTLVLATVPADYDSRFRWAEFDGEIWPAPFPPGEKKSAAAAPVPNNQ
jgi:hypothetical protein